MVVVVAVVVAVVATGCSSGCSADDTSGTPVSKISIQLWFVSLNAAPIELTQPPPPPLPVALHPLEDAVADATDDVAAIVDDADGGDDKCAPLVGTIVSGTRCGVRLDIGGNIGLVGH